MASTINGTSTGSGGLITTGDDSGILNIQTNETTAMSIDASQSVDFTNNIDAPNTFGFKNRIINSAMVIDQRNAGAAVTMSAAVVYLVDRWWSFEDTDGTMTAQQSSTAPTGFTNSLLCTTTVADASLGATQRVVIAQSIEGFNVADLGWGTASAQTVTLSFWVRSSLTGTFGGVVKNSATNRSYPFNYTINAANTFEQKSVTIAGDTTGTWLTNNGIGIQLNFGLGVGSTYSGTAGAWAAADYNSATGATSVVGTNGATFYITGVQLEKGTQATSFDFRSITQELALCQRYFYMVAKGATQPISQGGFYSSTLIQEFVVFPVTMRTTPSVYQVTGASYYRAYFNSTSITFNDIGTSPRGSTTAICIDTTVVGGTSSAACLVQTENASSALGFSAEL